MVDGKNNFKSMHMNRIGLGLCLAGCMALAAYPGFHWKASGALLSFWSWTPIPILAILAGISAMAVTWRRWKGQQRSGFAGAPEAGRYTLQTMLAAGTGETERSDGRQAILNHEIKNYLCTLKGNARLLRQRAHGNDQQAIIDRIDHAVEKLESFASEMGAPPTVRGARLTPVRLEHAARETVSNHFHREAGQDGRFSWDIRSDGAAILGDANRLEQVFLNLYVNAREAGARNVTTFLDVLGDRVLVRIEDDGRGCDSLDLPRIFEPFFSTKEGPARRGLGMFIVQSIVENHGGTIKVRSKNHLGAGSRGLVFHLEFPRLAAAPSRLPRSATQAGCSRRWLMALPEPF